MYDAFVVAHVVCAVVGFASVALSGVYGGLARKSSGTGTAEETARYFSSRGWSELLILPVPLLGAAALAVRRSQGGLGDVWVIVGMVVWLAAAALLIWVIRPAEARIRGGEGVERAGRSLIWAAAASDVLFVVALAVMVTQPK